MITVKSKKLRVLILSVPIQCNMTWQKFRKAHGLMLFKDLFLWANIQLFSGELLPWEKTEDKICWTYDQSESFVVKIKKMWKNSKFKDFILFV